MADKFPKIKKELDFQMQEVQHVPNKMNFKRSIPRHIIIKMARVKKKFLKAARKRQSHLQRNPHKATS